MKLKNILYGVMMGTSLLTLNTACTDDLNQYPHNETTSEQVYTNIQNYESVLGKIYASMTATGQESSGTDFSSNHGENYVHQSSGRTNRRDGIHVAYGRRYDQHILYEVGC